MLGEGVRAMKPIPGYEGRYSAQEDGRIYSHITSRYLKPGPCGGQMAYRHVTLRPGGSRNVHDLILRTFRGPPPEGTEARHLDGKGDNNALINLEWSTHSQNLLDKHSHGTMPKGELHPMAVLSDAQVMQMRELRAAGASYPKLAVEFGISTSQAHRICKGQNRRTSCG